MGLCRGIVLWTSVPRQLHQLYEIPKPSREFEHAFGRFYDNVRHEKIVDNLHGAKLQEFVDFLDEVLQLDGLNRELFRKVLHILWHTSGKRRILPRSHLLLEELLRADGAEVASGGYASVRRGVLVEKNSGPDPRNVCIKAIKVASRDGKKERSNVKKAFYEEVSVWMRLKHPNVVQCLGAVTNPRRIILDWVQNGEVMDYLRKNPDASRVHLVLDITKGLDYLHSCGVIHGDVKPNNILVNARGVACLADFGLAIVTCDKQSTRHKDPAARGHSTIWTAPETLTEARISKEADVFSYSLVAVEIFKGEPPWGGATAAQIMTKIMLGKRPGRPEGTETLGLTTELWNYLTACWRQKPEDRITISKVLTLLKSIVRADSVTVGASGSETSIGGATALTAAGTRESTSIRHRPLGAHNHHRSDSHVPPQTRTMSRRSSRRHARTTTSLEATAALRPNPSHARREDNPTPLKSFLKRCRGIFAIRVFPSLKRFQGLCPPSCISEKDMVR